MTFPTLYSPYQRGIIVSMGLQLNTVIPWGRSLGEYIRMFDLTSDDLKQSMLDCAGGRLVLMLK